MASVVTPRISSALQLPVSLFALRQGLTLPQVLNFALDQSKHVFEMTPAGPELGLSCPGCMFQAFLL